MYRIGTAMISAIYIGSIGCTAHGEIGVSRHANGPACGTVAAREARKIHDGPELLNQLISQLIEASRKANDETLSDFDRQLERRLMDHLVDQLEEWRRGFGSQYIRDSVPVPTAQAQ